MTLRTRLMMISVATVLAAALVLTKPTIMNTAATVRADDAPLLISFDAPGAGTGAGQGTFAFSINPRGAIAGFYVDNTNVDHGFVRSQRGNITTFDAPGAVATLAYGSNPEGTIVGFYFDSTGASHGFVRAPFGAIHTFDAPGAIATFAAQINPAGVIAGDYADASNVSHAYVRTEDGDITTFDAPGAGTGAGQGTMTGFIDCINPEGAMTGYVIDANNVFHGYVRAPDGSITTFDAPGAGTGAGQGTFPAGIDPAGVIAGDYTDAGNVAHGFVRTEGGTFTTFDVPGAGTGGGQGTIPDSINTHGAVTGQYIDASNVNHGFLRTRRGDITTFDVPGAGTGPSPAANGFNGPGTIPSSSDPDEGTTGYDVDASGVAHGFLLRRERGVD